MPLNIEKREPKKDYSIRILDLEEIKWFGNKGTAMITFDSWYPTFFFKVINGG